MTTSAAHFAKGLVGLIWRLAVYFVILIGVTLLLAKGGSLALHCAGVHFRHPPGVKSAEEVGLGEIFLLIAAGLSWRIMARLDRSRPTHILPARGAATAHALQGLLWGLASVGATVGAIAWLGGYNVSGLALSGPMLAYYATLWMGVAIINGLSENLAVLGYPFLRTAAVVGWRPAILFVGLLFTAGRLANAGENPLGLVSVFLVGVVLATAIYLTGDLWLSVGLHAGAVFAEDFVFSVPDSGVVYTGHLLDSGFSGPAWLSGAAAGPEGSVVALPVFATVLALMWTVYRRRAPARVSSLQA